jgi:hypothetical protein
MKSCCSTASLPMPPPRHQLLGLKSRSRLFPRVITALSEGSSEAEDRAFKCRRLAPDSSVAHVENQEQICIIEPIPIAAAAGLHTSDVSRTAVEQSSIDCDEYKQSSEIESSAASLDDVQEWMTISQAADTFRMSKRVISMWATQGLIASIKGDSVNSHRLVHIDGILVHMQQQLHIAKEASLRVTRDDNDMSGADSDSDAVEDPMQDTRLPDLSPVILP